MPLTSFDNLLIKDTMEVFAIDNSNSANVFFLGINSKANFAQKMTNTILRGNIGNFPVALLQTAKDLTYDVTPVLWSDSSMGMLSGNTATSGTATVKYFDKNLVVGGTASTPTLALTASTPTINGTTADIFDATNTHYNSTIASGVATITGSTLPALGSIVTAVYNISVTGNITDLNAANFPKSFKLYAHTVSYNPNTNVVASDIYLVLNAGIPDGSINALFEAGKESNLPIKFQLLVPTGSTSFGSYINVSR